ncbi:MAG: hypothetical protein KY397_03290 [Gemmatimonadetes bacterium]|nr:hypothetical protein [Gemmatimonadota bacterium]
MEISERNPTFLRITILGGFISAGETVPARLENLPEREIGFNLCLEQEYERWTGERWIAHEVAREGTCTLEVNTISPGETLLHDVGIGVRSLAPGIYRIAFGSVEWGLHEPEGGEALPKKDRTSNSVHVRSG